LLIYLARRVKKRERANPKRSFPGLINVEAPGDDGRKEGGPIACYEKRGREQGEHAIKD